MKKNFKKLMRKIFNRKQLTHNEELIKKGTLEIGSNTNIEELNIIIFNKLANNCSIKIGDDCLVMGTFTLYNEKASITIGDRVFIGPNTCLNSYKNIEIEADVMISWGCTIIDTDTHSIVSKERQTDVLDWKKGWEYKNWSNSKSKPIRIAQKSWIGFNSILTKGVTLEQGCIVAAGSVVSKSFDEFSVIGGNPANFIKKTT